MKKVVIVDDEEDGRTLIKEFLQDFPNFRLVAEANNGVDAISAIKTYNPDLVFLDIQMPGLDGFEVLTHLEELPNIIFSTAYDEYAIKAFEVHAVDYLLKPYSKERFKLAIERLDFDLQKLGLMANSMYAEKNQFPSKILVQKNSKLVSLSVEDIYWIEAYGNYAKLHLKNHFYLSNYGIAELETRLDPSLFLRVHRSSIINLNKVKEVHKHLKNYFVLLLNDNKIKVSRTYISAIKNIVF